MKNIIIVVASVVFATGCADTGNPSTHVEAPAEVSPLPEATEEPEATPETSPTLAPEPTPEETPEVTPEPTPEPDETPGPEATPEPTPEVTPEPEESPTPVDDGDADGDGYAENDGDCDDTDPAINPNAEEVSDGRDNNCDGQFLLVIEPEVEAAFELLDPPFVGLRFYFPEDTTLAAIGAPHLLLKEVTAPEGCEGTSLFPSVSLVVSFPDDTTRNAMFNTADLPVMGFPLAGADPEHAWVCSEETFAYTTEPKWVEYISIHFTHISSVYTLLEDDS